MSTLVDATNDNVVSLRGCIADLEVQQVTVLFLLQHILNHNLQDL